ncbi:MAG: phosphatidate cytidylyltransferase [Rickettsiales bacterium]|jgi:phosphatidate cytidylyltransferase|nr:phosphatidate cytidylyltransferase [Rickettsiales bacterium]
MTNTIIRILVAVALILGAIGAGFLEHFGIPVVRWVAAAICAVMVLETMILKIKDKKLCLLRCAFGAWIILMGVSAYFIGSRPLIMLLLLLIIAATDTGAWFFGKKFGGDKMWPAISPNKTWSGQIAGIICGTLAALLYGFIGTAAASGHIDYGQFMPQLMWIGMSVALLSQYGDLTASWIKRKLGIKDFSNMLPGHGGLIDRFDGWIYVLPVVWLVTL